jgi:hypothetical protein
MSRWIAINCCEETEALVKRHPNAFLLLTQIAMRAKYKPCAITKLGVGQAFIGDWRLAGIPSEMAYRHAKCVLTDCNLATFRGTNKGTVATLVNSTIFSISEKASNGPATNQPTDQQRVTTKTQGHSNTPLPPEGDGQTDDSPEATKKGRPGKGMTQAEKRRTTHPELTEAMQRIGSWFGRQPETLWSRYEFEAFQAVAPTDNQLAGMEFYYTAALEKDDDYRRRDVATLLNNWHGELDRARAFYRAHPQK